MSDKLFKEHNSPIAQGPNKDLALHTLGWKAFQDLASQICEEVFQTIVSIYREANDAGQDAVFLIKNKNGDSTVSSVQCKFTGKPEARLKTSDLNVELDNIKSLVANGNAHSYIFITNMGIDAPVASAIRDILFSLGVKDPHVLGKEWITLQIQESARLRALVPRVYGLGDLSTILDERSAAQTKALLGYLIPTLSVYVPTTAHRTAIRKIDEFGIVLLLGAPATGKSMIAAILATLAMDSDNHKSFKLDGPIELAERWNPNESGCFYWIDDAFGPNQLRDDYVDTWIAIMNKLKTAISAGNRFVLTSRTHIWNAALTKLATRNHPDLANKNAIVEVGLLSPEEKEQILYNHIKGGNQTKYWKDKIKPHLPILAKQENLLPEIARRLGDSGYTKGIRYMPEDLIKFVREPMEYLKETIQELGDAQRAALTLVFLNRSKLSLNANSTQDLNLVGDKYGVSQFEIGEALQQLNGSFLTLIPDTFTKTWTFKHPTISDALSEILRLRQDLVELYIRGVKTEAMLSEVVCIGSPPVRDALIIPESINEILVSRILETPDEDRSNKALFNFLSSRASDAILISLMEKEPKLLDRSYIGYWHISANSKIKFCARLHKLGILPTDHLANAVSDLKDALYYDFDASFLEDEELLNLFSSTDLLKMSVDIYEEILNKVPDKLIELIDEADLSVDPPDNFDLIDSFLNSIENVYEYSDAVQIKVDSLRAKMDEAIGEVEVKKNVEDEERRREEEEEEEENRKNWFWDAGNVISSIRTNPLINNGSVLTIPRSIFSDIDE